MGSWTSIFIHPSPPPRYTQPDILLATSHAIRATTHIASSSFCIGLFFATKFLISNCSFGLLAGLYTIQVCAPFVYVADLPILSKVNKPRHISQHRRRRRRPRTPHTLHNYLHTLHTTTFFRYPCHTAGRSTVCCTTPLPSPPLPPCPSATPGPGSSQPNIA